MLEEEIDTGGCLVMVGAGLQGDVEGGVGEQLALGRGKLFDTAGLGVRPPVALVVGFTEDGLVVHQEGPNRRIGVNSASSTAGQVVAAVKVAKVSRWEHAVDGLIGAGRLEIIIWPLRAKRKQDF